MGVAPYTTPGTAGGHKGRPYKLVGDFVGAGFIPARLLCVRGQLRSGGLREGDHGLEEVSVDVQTEGAALELGEAAGNGQAQAGALGGAGLLPPDEPLHEPLGGDVEGLAGDVLDGQDHLALPAAHLHIDAGALQGVLVAVGEQVVDDPPQVAAVGQDGALLLREGGHHGEAALGKFLLKLPQGLLDELHHAQPVQVHRQASGGRLYPTKNVLMKEIE